MSEQSYKSNLNEEEIILARKNGFILTGITGAGKTTLLNVLLGEEIGIVQKKATSVTQVSTVYEYKSKEGDYFSIIDTPGLSDTSNNEKVEKEHLDSITKVITEKNVQIKGILFLINFHKERLDAGEQEALINYNKLFPLRRFWKNIIIIYTHYFADPNGDDLEDMKNDRKETNKEIFDKIMNSIKDVSDVVDYDNINIKYFNSFSPLNKNPKKKENQRILNDKNKCDLEKELKKLSNTEPLFCKIENVHLFDFPIKIENKEYLAEIQFLRFY